MKLDLAEEWKEVYRLAEKYGVRPEQLLSYRILRKIQDWLDKTP